MTKSDYRVLSCEGGDQVGKGDSLNFLLDRLVGDEQVNVVTTSFPIYGTPIGNTIRVFLKEGGEKFDLAPREELEVKMALFALNRLEFLEVFLSEEMDENSLILFDRSAFSNALTIAYAMKKIPDIDKKEVQELVKMALDLDSLLIKTLNLTNCVVCLTSEGGNWENARGGDIDLHEDSEVQEYANYVYSLYQEVVGEGWKNVVTRGDGGWRGREEIFMEIREFVQERLGNFVKTKDRGERRDIGIKEIMKNIYIGSNVETDLLEEYVSSIRNNDKNLMYVTSAEVKEGICSTYERILFKNRTVRDAFREVCEKCPKIAVVLSFNLGAEFVNNLTKALEDE